MIYQIALILLSCQVTQTPQQAAQNRLDTLIMGRNDKERALPYSQPLSTIHSVRKQNAYVQVYLYRVHKRKGKRTIYEYRYRRPMPSAANHYGSQSAEAAARE